jgi:hypothetical protein
MKWAVAWRFGELSQQPTCPHLVHRRRCSQVAPIRVQSSQPVEFAVASSMLSRWVQCVAAIAAS